MAVAAHDGGRNVTKPLVLWLGDIGLTDVGVVGGKNASLGEMLSELRDAGVNVPAGFATTADAYWTFIEANGLRGPIGRRLAALGSGDSTLEQTGTEIRGLIATAELPPDLSGAVADAYERLGAEAGRDSPAVAVRSSGTAEDLPDASFAGQHESYLGVSGLEAVLEACKACIASLFTDRAIAYREERGYAHLEVALSVGVQLMVRSDVGSAGTMFTADPETGFPDVTVIDAAPGLGEGVVKGAVDPDRYLVHTPLLDQRHRPVIDRRLGRKEHRLELDPDVDVGQPTRWAPVSEAERSRFVLSEDQVLQLAELGVAIASHYGRAMDVEWAQDGLTGRIFIVQARPATGRAAEQPAGLTSYALELAGRPLVHGLAIGEAIASGPVVIVDSPDAAADVPAGAVVVARNTDPDWVPVMRRAAAIVTDHGGRTSHAAIVSRELDLPAVVGTGSATRDLARVGSVTVSCAEGDTGVVYEGVGEYSVSEVDLDGLPSTRTDVMLNLADPAAAMRWWRLPAGGVGLARIEFIISDDIGLHPLAAAEPGRLEPTVRAEVARLARGYDSPAAFFVDRLASGIARIAASRHPDPVIVRLSDFKSNEYAGLVGGADFEPDEENPMLGWRGASRYAHPDYAAGFALECQAVKRVRESIGLRNVIVMVPFCRTLSEADGVLAAMAENGLVRGQDGLAVYVMAEIPANVELAAEFAERFDGFSIGSNDLTQLTLGIDRDSERLAAEFDERDPAVTSMITRLISAAHEQATPVGFCGQRPSDDPDYARMLVTVGIDSISVTPDRFVAVLHQVARAEAAHRPRESPGPLPVSRDEA